MKEQIKALYEKYPLQKKFFEEKFYKTVEETLDFSIDIVDTSFQNLCKQGSVELSELLISLPQEKIISTFGEDTLLWSVLRLPDYQREIATSIRENASIHLKYTRSQLERVKNGLWQKYHNNDLSLAKILLNLYIDVLDVSNTFFSSYLKDPSKHTEFGIKELSTKYSNHKGPSKELSWDGKSEISYHSYLDAPFSFAIQRNNMPLWMCSFFAQNQDDLLIYQLQGINKKRFTITSSDIELSTISGNFVQGFPFKQSSVDLLSFYAKKHGFTSIGVVGAKNNEHTRQDEDGVIHLSFEKAHQIYDSYALSQGFQYRGDGNLYKTI